MGWFLPVVIVLAALAALVLVVELLFSTDGSRPMRDAPSEPASTGGKALFKSSYIEGRVGERDASSERKVSCSFVEFDERGDYLDFAQHQHCWQTIRKLAEDSGILLVLYCHGWKHNSQSGDVLDFNDFLAKLAASGPVRTKGLRVHGVYLSWRGSRYLPVVKPDAIDGPTKSVFSEAIVDSHCHNKFPAATAILNELSYYNRKEAAEHRVSGVPLARSVFSYASIARKLGGRAGSQNRNSVVLMGHSFGALMLEQSAAQAAVGSLVTRWPWFTEKKAERMRNYLPFDLFLMVNSAAPSLYAKMLRDLADAHDTAEDSGHPLFVSLTSKGDCATGFWHPLANFNAPNHPTMRRSYEDQVFEGEKAEPPVSQGEFYKRTPGHNKFLLSHRMVRADDRPLPDLTTGEIFERNLHNSRSNCFLTRESYSVAPLEWRIETIDSVKYEGRTYKPLDSAYWIIECEKDLIMNHNDIWNRQAMQAYAALLGLSQALE